MACDSFVLAGGGCIYRIMACGGGGRPLAWNCLMLAANPVSPQQENSARTPQGKEHRHAPMLLQKGTECKHAPRVFGQLMRRSMTPSPLCTNPS